MPFSKTFNAFSFIDQCIRSGTAGKVRELTDKLGVSGRQVHNYFNEMKALGAPLEYCRKTKRYYYRNPGIFFIGFLGEDSSL